MAIIKIDLNVPDDQISRFRNGLKSHYGKIEDPIGSGILRDLTNQEAIEKFRVEVIGMAKKMVNSAEVRQIKESLKSMSDIDVS